MKATSFVLLLVVYFFTLPVLNAQQKYEGILVTKMGQQEKGIITVNLDGENNELLEITTVGKSTSKSRRQKTKQTINTSAKLNLAFIHHIIINDTTYYFRDIKYDYNEKYYMNTPVRLIGGTLDCGIFQTGRSSGGNKLSIKLPNNEFSKLVAVDFDYYKATLGWHIMAFGKCISLRTKMENKEAGYSWNDDTSADQRISMWKNWIQEFNACK